ncbi:MAG: hypothetical protein KAS67_05325 [Thermoplasmata archaeon]|nr:hypothetical protein [Thermoplasmata archaeon]
MAELRIVVPDEVDHYLDMVIKSGMFGNKAELARAAIVQFLNTIGPISKGYDTDTFFSPEGRIHQIEYARESMKRGGAIMGIICKDGILMASEDLAAGKNSLMMSPLKIHRLGDNVLIGTSGLAMDGSMILGKLRQMEFADEEELMLAIKEIYWSHTIKKEVRPLGVGLIIGTLYERPRLFMVDPSGTVAEFTAAVIGDHMDEHMKTLAGKYKRMTIKEAGKLIPAILGKDKEFMVETI